MPSLSYLYLLGCLPEVSGVRQPAVELREPLQHGGQQDEGGPVIGFMGPAGRQDLLLTWNEECCCYDGEKGSSPLGAVVSLCYEADIKRSVSRPKLHTDPN